MTDEKTWDELSDYYAGHTPEIIREIQVPDRALTADDLVRIAGVPVEAVELVVALSRRADQPYLDYLAAVKASPDAALVKLADLEDNGDPARLDLLPEKDGLRLRKKYAQAVRFMTEA